MGREGEVPEKVLMKKEAFFFSSLSLGEVTARKGAHLEGQKMRLEGWVRAKGW